MDGARLVKHLLECLKFLLKALTLAVWFGTLISFCLAKPGSENSAILNYLLIGGNSLNLSKTELEHMVDVQYWFRIVEIGSVTWLFPQKEYPNKWISSLICLISIAVTCFAVLDFDSAWILFHHLLFSNQLWILPDDSYLIVHFYDTFLPAVAGALSIWLSTWASTIITHNH
jgi:uncharacterized membrane protein